ncbi:MAG TPA: tetratricopeptide repeat protein, partial [Pyrinomonadaceae bacterium]|nr:tetratricopeptide repeat protein [Pyrinomonadaceae bacterium]
QNAKATEYNTNVNTILKNANDAFNAKKYDEAISLYDQGTQAAPEEPVFHRNKATALNIRGVQKFIAASKLAAAERVAGKEEARKDFKAAIEESEKAVAMQKAKAASGDKTSTGDPSTALDLLNTRTESYRLASQTDTPVDPDVAIKAIEEYVAVETDATKKAEGQIVIGDVYFNSGRVAEAIAMYKQVLASNPNAINAMRGLGIALTVDPTGPKYAEARDLLQQFVDKAPENHPRRAETLDSVRYLDETMKTEASNKAEDAKKKSTKTRRP